MISKRYALNHESRVGRDGYQKAGQPHARREEQGTGDTGGAVARGPHLCAHEAAVSVLRAEVPRALGLLTTTAGRAAQGEKWSLSVI